MRPDTRSEGHRWLAQAENDLAFAELGSRENFFAEQVLGHSVAELAVECAKLDTELVALRSQAAPLDQFYLPTRYPNSLPGGIPAEAFGRVDAERALTMAHAVIAAVKRRLP
jgi:HEPN domain-containing protein